MGRAGCLPVSIRPFDKDGILWDADRVCFLWACPRMPMRASRCHAWGRHSSAGGCVLHLRGADGAISVTAEELLNARRQRAQAAQGDSVAEGRRRASICDSRWGIQGIESSSAGVPVPARTVTGPACTLPFCTYSMQGLERWSSVQVTHMGIPHRFNSA